MLTAALGEVPGAKVESALKATKTEAQLVTVDLDTSKADVGELAKAVGNARTPHSAKVAPSAALVVTAPGVTRADTDKVRKALDNVKGVDAEHSSAGQGEVIVALSRQGGARLADIRKALKNVK